MIHVATVHWRSDRWIDTQLRALRKFLPGPVKTYAFLNRIPTDHSHKFDYASSQPIKDHATKLNLLGELICFSGDPSDLLIFIDGDAFPVAPLEGVIEERLKRHRLIAVQRRENNGDIQPHPCFCVTTVGFWKDVGGDWYSGYKWNDPQGQAVTDVGGNLLGALTAANVDWYPLVRVNAIDVHPLYFGLYGDATHGALVYHHGGGFRTSAGGRVNRVNRGEREAKAKLRSRALEWLPRDGKLGKVRRRYSPYRTLRRDLKTEMRDLSAEVFAEIEADEDFWRRYV